MTLINKDMVMIAFAFAPTQMIMIGPKATLGREFKTVKNGSMTRAKKGERYIMTLTTKAIPIPREKAEIISCKVTHM